MKGVFLAALLTLFEIGVCAGGESSSVKVWSSIKVWSSTKISSSINVSSSSSSSYLASWFFPVIQLRPQYEPPRRLGEAPDFLVELGVICLRLTTLPAFARRILGVLGVSLSLPASGV